MFPYRSRFVTLVTAVVVGACAPAVAQQTMSADAFVDSVGVNIHLHYTGTPYWDQFTKLRDRLIELGVRHVRDGLIDPAFAPYYERFISLGQAGIKGTFITAPNQSNEVWAAFPGRVGSAFEAYEGPNELDKSSDPNWAQTLTETMKRLHALKDDPRVAPYPVYAPSLTTDGAYGALGDISAFFDYANMHNYFAGRHPGTTGWGANGYGSIAWNLDLNRRYAAGKPIVSTETGYQDDPKAVDGLPERIAGRYLPRMLLEQFRAGVVRTFIYELCDFPNSGRFGLLREDVSPKPAFFAVRDLLNLLSDPGPPFAVTDLAYSVEGATGDVHHMAFQKRNGTHYLALWLADASWDPVKRQLLAPTTRQAVVRLQEPMHIARTYRWQLDGTMATSVGSTRTASLPVSISDELMIIELTR